MTAAMTPSPASCSESSSAPTPPSRSTTAGPSPRYTAARRAERCSFESISLCVVLRCPAQAVAPPYPRSGCVRAHARVRAAERAIAPPAVPLGRQATPASRAAPPDLSRSPRSRGAGRRRSGLRGDRRQRPLPANPRRSTHGGAGGGGDRRVAAAWRRARPPGCPQCASAGE